MFQKLASFHEDAQSFFQATESGTTHWLTRQFPRLLFLSVFFFVAQTTLNVQAAFTQERGQDAVIQKTLTKQGESLVQRRAGVTFETKSGLLKSVRVHGDKETYQFYFSTAQPDTPFIYQETTDTWLTGSLTPSPLLTQAFIHFKIGLPETQSGHTVTVSNTTYAISETPFSVTIPDVGTYAPMPAMPTNVARFVSKKLGVPLHDLQVKTIVRQSDHETIYATHDDTLYEIQVFFDKSAHVGTVIAGHESILNLPDRSERPDEN